jgi:hypothetical protein
MGGIRLDPGDRELEIGTFSVSESLTEGTAFLWGRLTLVLPFILAALVGDLPVHLVVLQVDGMMPRFWARIWFAPGNLIFGLLSWLILAWAASILVERYRVHGIAHISGDQLPVQRFGEFFSRRNPLLKSLIGLGIVFASLSVAEYLSHSLGLVVGGALAMYGAWFIFWVLRLVLAFSIFGVLVYRESTRGSIELSWRIVSENAVPVVALVLGVMVISWVLSWISSWLVYPLMSLVQPISGTWDLPSLAAIAAIPVTGIVSAIRTSCLAYAFFSMIGSVDRAKLAARQGGAMEDCPGSPRIPECERCRYLQAYGDRYYCAKFGKTIDREQS